MSKNIFNSIEVQRPQHNAFDNTHDLKLSCNLGNLVPIMVEEAIPGDFHILRGSCMIRFAPMVAPVMHRLDVTLHYFFVPNRLLWENWEDFITNTDTGSGVPAFPTLTFDTANYNTLSTLPDYMGIPLPIAPNSETVNALPFAAYQKIWNEFYRDQNLMPAVTDTLVDGNNNAFFNDLTTGRRRAWEHDYFTSALPFAQKGAAVDVPMGDVVLKNPWYTGGTNFPTFENHIGTFNNGDLAVDTSPGNPITLSSDLSKAQAYDPRGTLEVAATTINDLRRAEMLQQWLELNARAGTRYTEFLQAHFNVKPEDARLQRPEYIVGLKTPVVISEVLNTSDTANAPQGNMAGHGIAVESGNFGKYAVKEHGFIIGIMSVMPKTAYQQGLQRHWIKTNDAFEYYFKQFEHIGEQEVYNKEVYAFQGAPGDDTFGYNPRYSEYKFANNRVAGQFRNTLDHWHWGRIFATPPSLNAQFIESDPAFRPFAVTTPTEDHLYCHILNKWTAIRPMSKYGTPHF